MRRRPARRCRPFPVHMPIDDTDVAALREALASMDAQLCALYDERVEVAALQETIASLDAQVCTLIEEKAELERQLAERQPAERPSV